MQVLNNIHDMWEKSSSRAKAGLIFGVLLIVIPVVWFGLTVLKTDYGVLFSELDSQDAAAIVAELDRLKIPYRLGPDETSILIDRSQVHATRLKLMGKGVTLRGGVGFEIFNNTDFGMTEFAQKINYQRALQGELTRTIMAFDEIKVARVHLVLPESGLFKKSTQKPKASITLAIKQGRTLSNEQVVGIQRLVAASVPEIAPDSVTVLDQRGVALSRAAEGEGEDGMASTRFALKNEVETYLTKKVVAVLDKTFGPGRAIVSVDVTVNHDQVKVTQEDVIPSAGHGREATGTIVRRKVSVQGSPKATVHTGDWQEQDARGNESSTQEVEYQSGRRVEQIVSKPGSIRRISVGVLLPHALEKTKVEEIRQVLAMAVGLNAARGDEIAISSFDRFSDVAQAPALDTKDALLAEERIVPPVVEHSSPSTQVEWRTAAAIGATMLIVVVIALGVAALQAMRRRREMDQVRLSERERLLSNVRQWLRGDTAVIDAERSV